ncbi:MAG TPA: sigma-70 family RNA polymerase sigma factor [Gemmataceae bacterium]|nr:sigma-70 family RNA polymerase sigma factor [Gemmataceae bacterium]
MTTDPSESSGLLRRAGQGDAAALGQLLEEHRKRLRRMVRLRLDPRLQGRIDPSDVIQETYLEAAERLADYLRDPKMPFFLWLRFLTGQKLLELRRHHLGTQARDAARELSIYQGAMPEASSACLAAQLLGKRTAPLEAAIRAEMKLRLQEALNGMEPMDREVLALRHFEQFNNAETAQLLGISESGASSRYLRALKRLKDILGQAPGFFEK